MDRTVHAQRSGTGGGLAKRLSRVLDAFHTKKLERGVDEMLVRLYKPIIWRGLRAGNPLVRANAATLLCSAFPLTDPGATRAEQDELMQKQFDTLGELLADEYPVVRLVGVEGVCRTLGVYVSFQLWRLPFNAQIGFCAGIGNSFPKRLCLHFWASSSGTWLQTPRLPLFAGLCLKA